MSPYRPRMSLGVCSSFAWFFKRLDGLLGRVKHMEQSSSRAAPHIVETTDTSGDETEGREPQKRVRSKGTYKMKKVWGGGGWVEPLICDWANRRIRETQSFLLQHLQRGFVCHETWSTRDLVPLPGDQGLSTRPASSVGNSGLASAWFWRQPHEKRRSWAAAGADLEGSISSERQRISFFRRPDRWQFGLVDVSYPVLAKVSALVETLRLGGSYELVHQLWSQFTRIARQVNVNVTWLRNEVLVSALFLPYYTVIIPVVHCCFAFGQSSSMAFTPHFEQCLHLGKDSWLLWLWVWGAEQTRRGVHLMLGQQPISSGLSVNSGSIRKQREWGGGCAETNHWCTWSKISCAVSARWSTCARGGLREVSGQWVLAVTDWLSVVWPAPFQMLPSTDCVKCVCNSGPQLLDRVHCEQAERSREASLHGFSTSTEGSHNKHQSWHTRTRGRRGQYCESVAFYCFVPKRDRLKRWRR